ncbi:MAG: hypothetical protein HYV16_05110 [Gammaproteobacteria bacterium]|nr:hypothetical protein [Gammaproteobacteria bacterium]
MKRKLEDYGVISVELALGIASQFVGGELFNRLLRDEGAAESVSVWHIQQLHVTHVMQVEVQFADYTRRYALQIAKDSQLAARAVEASLNLQVYNDALHPGLLARPLLAASLNSPNGCTLPVCVSEWLDGYERLDLSRVTEPALLVGDRAIAPGEASALWGQMVESRVMFSRSLDEDRHAIPQFSLWEGDFVACLGSSGPSLRLVWQQPDRIGAASHGEFLANTLILSYMDFLCSDKWRIDWWLVQVESLIPVFLDALKRRLIRESGLRGEHSEPGSQCRLRHIVEEGVRELRQPHENSRLAHFLGRLPEAFRLTALPALENALLRSLI